MEHTDTALAGGPESGLLKIRRILRKNGINLSDEQSTRLEQYVALVVDWNSKVNLVSRRDTSTIWEAHVLHSMSILLTGSIPDRSVVLDLGTGGGFPGVPIAIARPDLSMTLLDATRKKTEVLDNILRTIGLQGADVVWGRAEEVGRRQEYRGRFGCILARGVAPLPDIVRWSRPLLDRSKPAQILCLKGGNVSEEVRKTERSHPDLAITVRNVSFDGAAEIPGPDKKLVTVSSS